MSTPKSFHVGVVVVVVGVVVVRVVVVDVVVGVTGFFPCPSQQSISSVPLDTETETSNSVHHVT